MQLTKCVEHSEIEPVSTIEEARDVARAASKLVAKYDPQNGLGHYIATYQRDMRKPRCCPASAYSGYLMMAAWREGVR